MLAAGRRNGDRTGGAGRDRGLELSVGTPVASTLSLTIADFDQVARAVKTPWQRAFVRRFPPA
jgi:hypothetical protein